MAARSSVPSLPPVSSPSGGQASPALVDLKSGAAAGVHRSNYVLSTAADGGGVASARQPAPPSTVTSGLSGTRRSARFASTVTAPASLTPRGATSQRPRNSVALFAASVGGFPRFGPGSESSALGYSSTASGAAAASRWAHRQKTLLHDCRAGADGMPVPLAPGLVYAAEIRSIEELVQRRIVTSPSGGGGSGPTGAAFTNEDFWGCSDVDAYDYDLSLLHGEPPHGKKTSRAEDTHSESAGSGAVNDDEEDFFRAMAPPRLTASDVKKIYEARCADQRIVPAWNREMKFLELMTSSIVGSRVHCREFGFGPQSLGALCSVLRRSDGFTIVDVSGNRLGDTGATHLAQLVTETDSVIHLGARSCDIGTEGIERIAEALALNNTVTSLDLGGLTGHTRNHVGGRGAEALAAVVSQHPVLCSVDLSSTGLGLEGAGFIAQGLRDNGNLVSVNFAGNSVGADGATVLCAALQTTSVQKFYLQRNAIGDEGAAAVAMALNGRDSLGDSCLVANLAHNGIRVEGCRRLGAMLQSNERLRTLDLRCNDLGNGFAEMARRLKNNYSLKNLNVSQCGIGPEEVAVLAAAMRNQYVHLATLDVSKNRIGDEAGEALGLSLVGIPSLVRLNLQGCLMGPRSGRAFAATIRSCSGAANAALLALMTRAPSAIAAGASSAAQSGSNTAPGAALDGVGDTLFAKFANVHGGNAGLLALFGPAAGVTQHPAPVPGQPHASPLASPDVASPNVPGSPVPGVEASAAVHDRPSRPGSTAGSPYGRHQAVSAANTGPRLELRELVLKQNAIDEEGCAQIAQALRGHGGITELDLEFNEANFATILAVKDALRRNGDLFRQHEAPRLEAEVARLDATQRQHCQIDEDIAAERRAIKERTEELSRRKEATRVFADQHRRQMAELKEREVAGAAVRDERVSAYNQMSEEIYSERTKMEVRANTLQSRCDVERDKRERLVKECEKVKKQLLKQADLREEATRPLEAELEHLESVRDSARAECQKAASAIVTAVLRMKAADRGAGVHPEAHNQQLVNQHMQSLTGGAAQSNTLNMSGQSQLANDSGFAALTLPMA